MVRSDFCALGQYIYTDRYVGNGEYTLCPPFMANAHNSSYFAEIGASTANNVPKIRTKYIQNSFLNSMIPKQIKVLTWHWG